MHFKDSTINFLKSSEIISKVPWKSDIFNYGLIFQFDNIISSVLVDSVSACNAVVDSVFDCNAVINSVSACNAVVDSVPACNTVIGSDPNEPIIIENNSIYIKIGSNKSYTYKFKLNTTNVNSLIFEYFYNNVSKYAILNDTSTIDYLINFNLDPNSYLKIYTNNGNENSNIGIVNIYDVKRYDNDDTKGTFGAGDTSIKYDKIYIINLEHRKDRKDSVIKQLEKEGITNYEFITTFKSI
jgi:hypothetical protein